MYTVSVSFPITVGTKFNWKLIIFLPCIIIIIIIIINNNNNKHYT
jgi:hypothetical protein